MPIFRMSRTAPLSVGRSSKVDRSELYRFELVNKTESNYAELQTGYWKLSATAPSKRTHKYSWTAITVPGFANTGWSTRVVMNSTSRYFVFLLRATKHRRVPRVGCLQKSSTGSLNWIGVATESVAGRIRCTCEVETSSMRSQSMCRKSRL